MCSVNGGSQAPFPNQTLFCRVSVHSLSRAPLLQSLYFLFLFTTEITVSQYWHEGFIPTSHRSGHWREQHYPEVTEQGSPQGILGLVYPTAALRNPSEDGATAPHLWVAMNNLSASSSFIQGNGISLRAQNNRPQRVMVYAYYSPVTRPASVPWRLSRLLHRCASIWYISKSLGSALGSEQSLSRKPAKPRVLVGASGHTRVSCCLFKFRFPLLPTSHQLREFGGHQGCAVD